MHQPWLNTDAYSFAQLFWYLGGFALWGLAYVFVVRNAFRYRYVEVPALAVCGNITWEFLWGFVWWTQDMGLLLQLMYMGGCLLDVGILVMLFRFGDKQIASPAIRKLFRPIVVLALAGWLPTWWFMRQVGYDLPLGSNSAYVINVVMSVLYLQLVLTVPDSKVLSLPVAWLKRLGTLMVTVFCFLTYDNPFTLTLGVICAILDGHYVVLLHRRLNGTWQPEGVD
jgi:hypothetical protein